MSFNFYSWRASEAASGGKFKNKNLIYRIFESRLLIALFDKFSIDYRNIFNNICNVQPINCQTSFLSFLRLRCAIK